MLRVDVHFLDTLRHAPPQAPVLLILLQLCSTTVVQYANVFATSATQRNVYCHQLLTKTRDVLFLAPMLLCVQ